MNIIIVNKEIFQNRPPVISTLLELSDLGHNLHLITVDINDYWKEELQKRNISLKVIPDCKKRNRISKVVEYLRFKKETFKYIKENFHNQSDSYLWAIGGNTIWCLGEEIANYRFILQIQELHEQDASYLKLFKKIINKASLVFMNEYNRTILYQCWFKMKKRPIVLPNKPYYKAVANEDYIKQNLDKSIYDSLTHKKVILFQGQIVNYRDLSCYILAAKEVGGYQIVLMGRAYDNMIEKYRLIDPTVIHIPFIPAPHYYAVTEKAWACLITYDPLSLNNAYCAPNKIYEYGALGKPIIGNDIPGLQVIEKYNAGILIDENNVESIKCAIKKIKSLYPEYQKGSYDLYESVNRTEIIQSALKSL